MLLLNVHNFMDENTKEILPLYVCLHPWCVLVCTNKDKKNEPLHRVCLVRKVTFSEVMKDGHFMP